MKNKWYHIMFAILIGIIGGVALTAYIDYKRCKICGNFNCNCRIKQK